MSFGTPFLRLRVLIGPVRLSGVLRLSGVRFMRAFLLTRVGLSLLIAPAPFRQGETATKDGAKLQVTGTTGVPHVASLRSCTLS